MTDPDDRAQEYEAFKDVTDAHADNPWFQRPDDLHERREIKGQLCIWDDDPIADFGQIWMPICPDCGRGPLDQGQRYCHGTECKVGCPGCDYCKPQGLEDMES